MNGNALAAVVSGDCLKSLSADFVELNTDTESADSFDHTRLGDINHIQKSFVSDAYLLGVSSVDWYVTCSSGRTGYIPVYRANPQQISIRNEAFLDVVYITQARVVEAIGGFSIRIQFDEIGTKRLQTITTYNRGKRIAIHSNFDDSRWLAAPQIIRTITNGVLIFTPE